MGGSHLCLIINSSINFLVYSSVGPRFRAAVSRVQARALAKLSTATVVKEVEEVEAKEHCHQTRLEPDILHHGHF